MTYCKDYCEEKGISTSKLNEAQKTLYHIAENMKMEESISEEGYKHFQMAIKALEQEPILDKIRAEIENDWQLKKYPSSPFSCGLRRAIEIIDKYRAICNNLEALEQQPCEDCVSKTDVLKLMCEKCPVYNCITGCQSYRSIEKMSSVTLKADKTKSEGKE